jgi:hypothetical protein
MVIRLIQAAVVAAVLAAIITSLPDIKRQLEIRQMRARGALAGHGVRTASVTRPASPDPGRQECLPGRQASRLLPAGLCGS